MIRSKANSNVKKFTDFDLFIYINEMVILMRADGGERGRRDTKNVCEGA